MGFSLLRGKTDHMTDNKKQVQEAKEKVYETAQAAKNWTTESNDQTASYFSVKTGATKDKASEVAQSTQTEKDKSSEVAQAEKDKTAGGLGNTAEQVKSVATGTMEAVKQKLGMGTKSMYINLAIWNKLGIIPTQIHKNHLQQMSKTERQNTFGRIALENYRVTVHR